MDILALIGLFLNAIGTIFLAFALNRTISMFNTSFTALETTNTTLFSGGDVINFKGLGVHRKSAMRKAKNLTWAGLFFLFSGILFQIISLAKSAQEIK
jgi:hypothetical protein